LLLIIGYKFNEIENFLIKFDFSKIFDLQFEKIFTEDNFKIDTIPQLYPVHYHIKSFANVLHQELLNE
jgi:hypothetical protein